MERYTCPRRLVPMIVSTLASEGYTVQRQSQPAPGGTRVTVITLGRAVVAFHERPAHDTVEILVFARAIVTRLPRLSAQQTPQPLGE